MLEFLRLVSFLSRSFLIYINDLLNLPSNPIDWNPNNNTPNIQNLQNNRENIASSINLDLSRLKIWGFHNLVNFNTSKTRLISRRVDRDLTDISFILSSFKFCVNISMLGEIWPFLEWLHYICSKSWCMNAWHSFLDQTLFHE